MIILNANLKKLPQSQLKNETQKWTFAADDYANVIILLIQKPAPSQIAWDNLHGRVIPPARGDCLQNSANKR